VKKTITIFVFKVHVKDIIHFNNFILTMCLLLITIQVPQLIRLGANFLLQINFLLNVAKTGFESMGVAIFKILQIHE
jgi:hypothetical protein